MRTAPFLPVAALAGCDGGEGRQSILHPHGDGAEMVATLWWLTFAMGAAVFVVVVGFTVWALFRKRPDAGDPSPPREAPVRLWLGVGGVAVPASILTVVFAATLATMWRQASAEDAPHDLAIEITGYRWWWDVEYLDPVPQRRVRTANEIRIPTDRSVKLRLTSSDIIHSLWVPNLQYKVDMIPGRTNELWISAREPGIYRGQCAEFCGLQHANMALYLIAMEPAEYDAWYAAQLREAPDPTTPLAVEGRLVFMERGCAMCHAIRGTMALSRQGPDLTHLASRISLGAGILPNTRGHLGGWVTNPQAIKPGVLMPNMPLNAEQLRSLLAYLETLE